MVAYVLVSQNGVVMRFSVLPVLLSDAALYVIFNVRGDEMGMVRGSINHPLFHALGSYLGVMGQDMGQDMGSA